MWPVAVNLIVLFFGIYGLGEAVRFIFARKAFESAAFSYCLGMVAIYLVWLLTWNTGVCYALLLPHALWGLWRTAKSPEKYWVAGSFFCLSILFLSNPIELWDARSIWFFQAKMLHELSGASLAQFLVRPEIEFTHTDTPKLMPLLGALASYRLQWSEYLPKAAMVLLWLPIPLAVKSLSLKRYEKLFLAIILISLGGAYFVLNDFMDWLLAVYASVGAWILFHEEDQKPIGLLLLSIAFLLKVEGAVLAGMVLGWYFLPRYRSQWRLGYFFLPAAAAWLIWKLECRHLGVESYFTSAKTSVWQRLCDRLSHPGNIYYINQSLFQANRAWFELLFVAFAVYVYKKIRVDFTLLKIALSYWLFLVFVYLSTPWPMTEHIYSSIDRTTLPIYLMSALCLLFTPKIKSADVNS